ncbi:MAG: histidine--tRNA ligase [Candidatus Pacebacteria bacterium]|nr:histidine--tRNA ligase [Candidatus Paceibacterota bacterium]
MSKDTLSTEPYKGVRDFYPEDAFIQEYLFEAMKTACEKFGFEAYGASVMEPSELYRSKNSDEIVNEQTYTFTDRGDREVTLRPEMTPSVARMVAGKRHDLTFPLRWYAIPNCFRYERPQRGRVRDFWQLNADIFGAPGIEAEAEVIALAHAVMLELGATENDFEIRINDRRMLSELFKSADLTAEQTKSVMQLLDRKAKIDDFDAKLFELVSENQATHLLEGFAKAASSAHLEALRSLLYSMGVGNVVVDTSIVRGFDYYTGVVFEVFDTAPENRRSLFGGGRYDNLTELFGGEPITGIGFGMGDVTARDFLESHDLLPAYRPATELMLCPMDEASLKHALTLAQELRRKDVAVTVNLSGKKIGDQIKQANNMSIPFIIGVGARERESGSYTLKQLSNGNEHTLSAEHIADHLFSALG